MTRRPAVRTATPLAAPRTGLLVAASVSDSMGTVRWGKGVDWLGEMHPTTSEGYGARALECTDGTDIGFGADDKAPTHSADAFAVYAYDWCSAMEGVSQRDWAGRARRLMEATQSKSIAQEFWAGALSSAQSLSNTWLAKSTATVVTSGAKVPAKALALLDRTVMANLANGRGMIHTSPEVLVALHAANAIERTTGGLWVTANGTYVVADGGYSGDLDGQAGNTEWMIATTVPEIVLGEIRVSKADGPEGGEMVSVSVNDVFVYAERDVIVMHEPAVLHHAAQVDLT